MTNNLNIMCLLLLFILTGCESLGEDDDLELPNEALTRVADKMFDQHNNETAAKIYTQILTHDPQNAPARIKLAKLIKEEGHFGAAISELEKIPEDDSLYGEARSEIVICHIEANEIDEANMVIDQLLQSDPDQAKYLNLKGVCLDMIHEHVRAQHYYNLALQHKPDFISAKSNLGLSLAISGHAAKGVKVLEAVIKNPFSTSRDRQNLAVAYALNQDFANAEKIFLAELGEKAAQHNLKYLQKWATKHPKLNYTT